MILKNPRYLLKTFIVVLSVACSLIIFLGIHSNYHAVVSVANAQINPVQQFLPLVYRKIPPPWSKLYGYSSFYKVTSLPLQQISEYTSFLYTYHRASLGWPDEADLSALREAGLHILLKLDPQVVEDNFDEAALRGLKARIDPYKDVIWALGVIDEPYRPTREPPLTSQELENLVAKVKAIFPDYLMYVNFLAPYYVEEVTGQPFPEVPDNIDLISTDILIHLGEISGDDEYKLRVGRNLSIILDRAHGRPVFYAAPAYGEVDNEATWPTAHQAQLDYELYQEYGLDGLSWFFYDDTSPDQVWWGSSHWTELLSKHQELGQAILNLRTVSRLPVVFAVEQQTNSRYEDIESKIILAIEDVNARLRASGILREFYIDHYAPIYDKTQVTGCRPTIEPNRDNGYLPDEYCNHPSTYLFIVADETNSLNWMDIYYPSVEWHGVKEDPSSPPDSPHYLFSTDGMRVLSHETGHILGLPDLYLLNIEAQYNYVNGEAFPEIYNPWANDIMYDLPGSFSLWDQEIIKRENMAFPFRYQTWFDYVPKDTVLKLVDEHGNPLTGVAVNVYNHVRTFSGTEWNQVIDSIPDWSGIADTFGFFHLGPGVLGTDKLDAVKVFLVEVDVAGNKYYAWFNFQDVNWSYWDNIPIEIVINSGY